MRCKTCDYPLWNLTNRQCPECGAAFTPSEFEFVLNSVRFCCPHCDQAYYGTGPTGHLVPAAFNCVKCSQPINMDLMVLRPAEGVREEQTKPDAMPWLEGSKSGWVKGWLGTVGRSLVAPGRLMQQVPESASNGAAWGFLLITSGLVALTASLPFTCLAGAPMVFSGGSMQGSRSIGVMAGVVGGFMGFGLALWLIGALLWGASAHGILRLTGATQRIGRTMQAICYSSGASIASAVPCMGLSLGWIWWVVSAVVAVKEAQRVSAGRAALAVLALPAVSLVLGVVGYAGLLYSAGVFSPGMRAGGATAATGGLAGVATPGVVRQEVQTILQAVLDYGQSHGGRGPAHAAELLDGATIFGPDFVTSDSQTLEEDVPIADTRLAKLAMMGPNRQLQTVQAAIDALPPNTIAHRVGDFVFTHHGMDLTQAAPDLWVVVMTFDPDSNDPALPQSLYLGRVDGQVKATGLGRLQGLLKAQNLRRAQAGLPPLPDPTTITHDKPAISAAAGP